MKRKPMMRHWGSNDRSMARAVNERARNKWGRGWLMLSTDAKIDAIRSEVCGILIMQMDDTMVSGEAIKELHRESLREAGLLED